MENNGSVNSPLCQLGILVTSSENSDHTSTTNKGCNNSKRQTNTSAREVEEEDCDIQTLIELGSAAELIVLDESGGEDVDEEGEQKTVLTSLEEIAIPVRDERKDEYVEATEDAMILENNKLGDRDSDIEIVSSGKTPNSVDSGDSLLDDVVCGENDDQCQGFNCPFKKKLNLLKKRYRLMKRKTKRLGKSARALYCKTNGVEVKFPDATLARKYRTVVENFVNNLLKDEDTIYAVQNAKSSMADSSSAAMLYECFYIDKCGQNTQVFPPLQASSCTPLFERRFDDKSILCKTSGNDMKGKEEIVRPVMSCFNCLGDHTIVDCTEPRDMQRIAQNRNDYMSKRQNLNSPRYHVEDIRHDKFVPGKLSTALRRALGLKRDELPIHIYKMRLIGYPPGWLKEAEMHGSGISLYDSDGKVLHDPLKLVDFPGFNVATPEGTIDDWKKLGFPPMQAFHMKNVVERMMKDAYPNKRKRSPDVETIGSAEKRQKVSVFEVEESMELEECKSNSMVDGEANENEVQLVTQLPSTAVVIGNQDVNVQSPDKTDDKDNPNLTRLTLEAPSIGSPSLEDLESAKDKLISALGSDSAGVAFIEDYECTPVKNATFSANSKEVCLGSPAIYQASLFSSLPCPDKFSLGISKHMSFENLPDSTGSFEKMRGVLKGVRRSLSQPNV